MKSKFMNKHSQAAIPLLFIGFVLIASAAFGQQAQPTLPVVVSASAPIYPRVAHLMHIQGEVRIRVTTDGSKIVSFADESGPAMLVQAVKDNLRTWMFNKHDPTSFVVTFRYHIEDESSCSIENSSVVLHLPSLIEISAKGIQTCDPAIDLTKPLALELTVTLDGKTIPPPKQMNLRVGDHLFDLPGERGKFMVPPEVLQADHVEFSAVVGKDRIHFGDIYGGKFAEESWKLILADRHFPEEYEWANKQADIRTSCVLVFEYEEETVLTATSCRTRIKK
jgi:hypothetical protein